MPGDRWDTWVDSLEPLSPIKLTNTYKPVPRMTSLGDLLPVPSFHNPSRLMLWLYCGYGWRMKAIARLLGEPEKHLWTHLVWWRDAHQIQLDTEQLRAKPRRGYSEELRAEVTAWRQHRREKQAKRARRAEINARARERAQLKKAQPERFALRNACIVRWHAQGVSLRDCARRVGISPARAVQIWHQRRSRPLDEGVLPVLSAAEARCLAVTVGAMIGLMEARG